MRTTYFSTMIALYYMGFYSPLLVLIIAGQSFGMGNPRLSVGTGTPLLHPDTMNVDNSGLSVSGASLLGDYYFSRTLRGTGSGWGFRATSGVFLGSRSSSLLWSSQSPGLAGRAFNVGTGTHTLSVKATFCTYTSASTTQPPACTTGTAAPTSCTVPTARSPYVGARLARFRRDLAERLGQLPGVDAAAFADHGLFSGGASTRPTPCPVMFLPEYGCLVEFFPLDWHLPFLARFRALPRRGSPRISASFRGPPLALIADCMT